MLPDPDVPRFRFASDPARPLHLPDLRKALFNWALSRNLGGDLILRIDDSGNRSEDVDAAQQTMEALRWLGLDWEEGPDLGGDYGPYYRSQRRERHHSVAHRLLETGAAYRDVDAGVRLRLTAPDHTSLEDLLRGTLHFDHTSLEEPLLLDSSDRPQHLLATVVDDHDMAISHVIRDAQAPELAALQAALYRALEWEQPAWLHLPPIHNLDDDPHHYQLDALRQIGYLPQALFNYLLLLGWSPEQDSGEGPQIVSKWNARRQVSIQTLSRTPARFEWQKLNRINRHYLQQNSNERLAEMITPYLEEAYGSLGASPQWLVRLAALIRGQLSRLSDAVDAAEWALSETFDFTRQAEAALESEPAHPILVRLLAELAAVVLLDEQTARRILQGLERQLSGPSGWEREQLYAPIYAALTGKTSGPPLDEIMALLGKGRCLERIAVILR